MGGTRAQERDRIIGGMAAELGGALQVWVQGRFPALHPPTTFRWRQGSSGPSNPSAMLRHGAQPAWVMAMAAWRDRVPERHRNRSGALGLTPAASSMAERRDAKPGSICIAGNLCHSMKSGVLPSAVR